MKIAVISDIHSNIDALENVLNDIKNRDVDKIILTGDLVGYLPFPNEVIKCIQSNNIISIKGNHDKRVSEYDLDEAQLKKMSLNEIQSKGSLVYTSSVITDENKDYLRNLPEYIKMEIEDIEFLFVHGSSRSIDEYLYDEEELLKSISNEVDSDVIVFGHTHIPFHRTIDHKYFINAGSVGKPKHGEASSTYVIINVIKNQVTSEIIYVPYNHLRICNEIKDNDMISDELIENIINGN